MPSECSVTVSMHMLIDHGPLVCIEHDSGLLPYSEEAAASLHAECKSFFEQWKLPKVVTGSHSRTLLNVMSAINSAHLYVYAFQNIRLVPFRFSDFSHL